MRVDRTTAERQSTKTISARDSVVVYFMAPLLPPKEDVVAIDLGEDRDGNRYTLRMTVKEATLLNDLIYQNVLRWE